MAEIRCAKEGCDFHCEADLPGEQGLHQLVNNWRGPGVPEDILKIYDHHIETRSGRHWGHSNYQVNFMATEGVFEPVIEKFITIEGGLMQLKNF